MTMNGQKKSYDRYLESLRNTPGPVDPPTDKTMDLRGLLDYMNKTGKKVVELSNSEMKRFVIETPELLEGLEKRGADR